ncbi:SDR family NAD(P)-dependent oxidoreductase [Agreia sp. VKM Ac-1783]|uniref:SDR family NAD(P)-dependent oxidoreductase n=1 Tax=Agreia sp. VKM Ac-1783 TaxID=1938889 RepID=UPI000A2ABD4F|nr:SDR family NAD(P)-dependent oxidoreductase [Agreia sp. VKM Ac-1783]SMQ74090.1 cyclic-di-GMP-binding biofilm dispersal mediator protein [Agreia sp. VKM Ac-1783]
MTELRGKRILVVGATGGLGSRIARRLSEAGAVLALSARDVDRLDALDLAAETIPADLHRESAAVVAEAERRLGGLDAVVIASGVVAFGPASELEPETVADLFAVNAASPIELITAALPALSRSAEEGREPVVVTISGIVAEAPTAGLAAYSASKAALAAFMVAAGRENRRAGIRLLDARPGHTETGLVTRAIAGTAPAFPAGHDADHVAGVIVDAIASGARDLPSSAF